MSAGVWDNHAESTADVAFTPVFRIERKSLYARRTFSTALQCGDHIGAGIYAGHYDIGVRIQHLSNGGFRSPNPGINFVLLCVRLRPSA